MTRTTRGEDDSLLSACSRVLVVAHREDTSQLRQALEGEGFAVEEVRGPYTAQQENFSAIMRCFVNHANAWRKVVEYGEPAIVVEADFVPVRGLGRFPVPSPKDEEGNCLPYLYAVSPEIWDLARPDIARGHAGGLVAVLIYPKIAALLLQYFDEEILANPTGAYTPFDSKLGYWLLERKVQSYFPYRHYGEHGGIANPEHARAGLGRPHQADVLQGKLAFRPMYARGSIARYWRVRCRARFWGMARLLCGRYLPARDFRRSSKWPMLRYVVGRFALRSIPSRRRNLAPQEVREE